MTKYENFTLNGWQKERPLDRFTLHAKPRETSARTKQGVVQLARDLGGRIRSRRNF